MNSRYFTPLLATLLLLACMVPLAPAKAQSPLKSADEDAIRQTLKQQTEAWNAGHIEEFMHGYWASDSLKFIGSRGLTRGYQPTLSNYLQSYPDLATMGKLTFTLLSLEALGKKNALVIGKWHLARKDKGDLEGHFSLVWEKKKGAGWVIIADHSS
jgi:ketosteroid isomerase-like protein